MLIESGTLPADQVMAKDALLLQELHAPVLHLYEMEGRSATYGHFTDPKSLINLAACEEEKIVLAKRPTGGGIIFHFLDLAFSYLVPRGHPHYSENTLENYRTVNTLVQEALKELLPHASFSFIPPEQKTPSTFCMAHPTPYDLLANGKKIAGAAQRKTRLGFLHQGTISILAPPQELLNKLLYEPTAAEIINNSFYFTENPAQLTVIRRELVFKLKKLLSSVTI